MCHHCERCDCRCSESDDSGTPRAAKARRAAVTTASPGPHGVRGPPTAVPAAIAPEMGAAPAVSTMVGETVGLLADAGVSEASIARLKGFMGPKSSFSTAETWEDVPSKAKERVLSALGAVAAKTAEDLVGERYRDHVLADLFASPPRQLASGLATAVQHDLDRVTANLVALEALLPPSSIEYRTARAVLVRSWQLKELNERLENGRKLARRAYTSGSNDARSLFDGKKLETTSFTQKRYNEAAVDAAVDYILSEECIVPVSWGAVKLLVDGKEITFPALTRRGKPEFLYQNYVAAVEDEEARVGRTAFLGLVSDLTKHEVHSRTAVDYLSSELLDVTWDAVERMLERLGSANVSRFKSWYMIMGTFLRHHYIKHLTHENVGEKYHNIPGALGFLVGDELQAYKDSLVSTCQLCNLPSRFFTKLREELDALIDARPEQPEAGTVPPMQHNDLCASLSELEHRLRLYQGHVLRLKTQRDRIEELKARVADDYTYVYCVMDFKMKFESMYYRQSTQNHFGKAGTSWHGVVIFYRMADSDEVQTIYYNQVVDGDRQQDAEMSVSLLEAMLMRVRKLIAGPIKLIIQSDNAPNYSNATLRYAIYKLNQLYEREHEIFIETFIHTEPQDGKGLVDAMFSWLMRLVEQYVDMGYNVTTALQLVKALDSAQGLHNTISEVIRLDRTIAARVGAGVIDEKKTTKEVGGNVMETRYYPAGHAKQQRFTSWFQSGGRSFDVDAETMTRLKNEQAETPVGDDGDDASADENNNADAQDPGEAGADDLDDAPARQDDCDDAREVDDVPFAVGPVTGVCVREGAELRHSRWKSYMMPAEPPVEEANATADVVAAVADASCDTCGAKFKSEAFKNRHVCKGPRLDNSMAGYARRRAVQRHEHGAAIAVDGTSETDIPELPPHPADPRPQWRPRWAWRPQVGTGKGENVMHAFKKDIFDLVMNEHKFGSKLSADVVLKNLQMRYPSKIIFPTIAQIKAQISANVKLRNEGLTEFKDNSRRGLKRMDVRRYVVYLVEADYGARKPREYVADVLQRFSDLTKDETKQLKLFVGSQRKKAAM